MDTMAELLIFTLTLLGMEVFAYVMHLKVMHGVGWFLHESHHRARSGMFELNDLYAVIFAIPSIVLIYGGVQAGWGSVATVCGAGIAAYGFIYFVFHDVVVHQRVPIRMVVRSAYLKRIIQAHKLHHAVESRKGAVSFGFIYAPPIATLKKQLQDTQARQLRRPAT